MLVQESIKALDEDVENLCVQSEEKGDLTLLSKANAFMRASKEKKENVHVLNKALLELQDKLKNLIYDQLLLRYITVNKSKF